MLLEVHTQVSTEIEAPVKDSVSLQQQETKAPAKVGQVVGHQSSHEIPAFLAHSTKTPLGSAESWQPWKHGTGAPQLEHSNSGAKRNSESTSSWTRWPAGQNVTLQPLRHFHRKLRFWPGRPSVIVPSVVGKVALQVWALTFASLSRRSVEFVVSTQWLLMLNTARHKHTLHQASKNFAELSR